MTSAGSTAADTDWEALRAVARDAMSHAYAPYSGYPVGVAALVDDGRTVSGCNVENASHGLGLCAECGLVSELQRTGPAAAPQELILELCTGRRTSGARGSWLRGGPEPESPGALLG